MSDYLQHLVARTLSPGAGVRPQLRSAFEPPPLHGGFTLPADLELDTAVESVSSASLPPGEPTQFERVPGRQPLNAAPVISAMGDGPSMPPLDSNEDKDVAPVQPLQLPEREPRIKPTMSQPALSAPPNLFSENISAQASPPRPGHISEPRRVRAAPISDGVHPGAAVLPRQTVASEEPRPEQSAVVAIGPVAPATNGLRPGPSVVPTSVRPLPATEGTRNEVAESEERRPERSAVAAIRPVVPAAPVFSPSLAPAVALSPQTIHVTIGRVEVRATPPPAGARAKAALPPAMSLEEYLGRRAAGGQR